MIIPENLNSKTKSGLEINFEFDLNCKPHGSDRWLYHTINAFSLIENEKINVGYLRIAYISEEKHKENTSDIIQYLVRNNKINIDNKNTTTKNITKTEMIRVINKTNFPEDTTDRDIINYFKIRIKIDHLKDYEAHLRYHYLKPESDFVEVKKEYQRNGIGLELYKKAIEFCNINNLNFYQSTTQTEEAVALWKNIKDTLGNCNSYEYLLRNGDKRERFYVGKEKPVLEFENGLNNINEKSFIKKNIKSI